MAGGNSLEASTDTLPRHPFVEFEADCAWLHLTPAARYPIRSTSVARSRLLTLMRTHTDASAGARLPLQPPDLLEWLERVQGHTMPHGTSAADHVMPLLEAAAQAERCIADDKQLRQQQACKLPSNPTVLRSQPPGASDASVAAACDHAATAQSSTLRPLVQQMASPADGQSSIRPEEWSEDLDHVIWLSQVSLRPAHRLEVHVYSAACAMRSGSCVCCMHALQLMSSRMCCMHALQAMSSMARM
eukprot:jgi/Ulvmu1/10702/UM067_0028.1